MAGDGGPDLAGSKISRPDRRRPPVTVVTAARLPIASEFLKTFLGFDFPRGHRHLQCIHHRCARFWLKRTSIRLPSENRTTNEEHLTAADMEPQKALGQVMRAARPTFDSESEGESLTAPTLNLGGMDLDFSDLEGVGNNIFFGLETILSDGPKTNYFLV